MAERVILRFSRHYGTYRAGEVAGFDAEAAKVILGTRRVEGDGNARREMPVAEVYDPDRHGDPGPPAVVAAVAEPAPLVPVRFTRQCGSYQSGEVAAFTPTEAQVLVFGGPFQGTQRTPVAEYLERRVPAPGDPRPAPASAESGATNRKPTRVASRAKGRERRGRRAAARQRSAERDGMVRESDKDGMAREPDKAGTGPVAPLAPPQPPAPPAE